MSTRARPASAPRLGAHMSTSGGFACAVERALEVDATALQIFAKSARQWESKAADPEQVERFRAECATAGLGDHCMTHASYLINLASPDRSLRGKSRRALVDELRRAEELGIPFVVLHPGSHVGSGEEAGLGRVAAEIDRAFRELDKKGTTRVRLLLENTAGQGSNLGYRFEHLASILEASAAGERLGVCFDTCHALAAGYDFRTAKGYRETFEALDRNVGLSRLLAFHLNDSKFELGSRRDRHQHIGEGEVGIEGFRRLMRDMRFRGIPMVLETPKGEGSGEDMRNLDRLRTLAREAPLRVDEFDFDLPPESIAQSPAARRDASRLLRLDRSTGAIEHRRFDELPRMLRAGDLLVVNDTRVVPARLIGRKESGGRVELLLLEREGESAVWRTLMKCSRKPKAGDSLVFEDGLRAGVVERRDEEWRVEFAAAGPLRQSVYAAGRPPLPPYIRREDEAATEEDAERYQTVYAAREGAIAAPTAGLHFTPGLLEAMSELGVRRTSVTLHVGRGTFVPVTVDRVEAHRMHDEWCEVPPQAAEEIRRARERGGRVVAVGTTVVRTLESHADEQGRVRPGSRRSSIFIYPGYRFRAIDALITNFHLPRSTLLMLVSAFADRQRVLQAYREAVRLGYRFYSYGDAMLIEDFS